MSVGVRAWMFWGWAGIMAVGLGLGAWAEAEAAGPPDSAGAEAAGEVWAEAERAVRAGDLERAAELYGTLTAAGEAEASGRARLGLAACQLRLGRLAEAIGTLQGMFPQEGSPGDLSPFPSFLLAQAHALLAEGALRRMDYRGALIHLFHSLLLHPTPSVMREAGEQVTTWSSPEDVRAHYEMILGEEGGRQGLDEEQMEQRVQFWGRCYEGYFLAYQGGGGGGGGSFPGAAGAGPGGATGGGFLDEVGGFGGGAGAGLGSDPKLREGLGFSGAAGG